jgi:ABC-type nitrate/sulfonate/bicarbonate transport system permease component
MSRRVPSVVRHTRNLGLPLVGLAAVFVVWQLSAAASNATKIPPPSAVLSALRADWSNIRAVEFVYYQSIGIENGLLFTFWNVLLGVAIGGAIGFPLGIAIARGRLARLLLEPALLVLGTVPLLIILPFISFWFGTSRLAQSGLVIIFTMLTVTFAAKGAAMAVGAYYSDYAACLGASHNRILWTVVLPATLPNVLGAVRLAFAVAWGLELVAEQLGARSGLGIVIRVSGNLSATADLFAAVLCLAVVAVALDAVVASVGKRVVIWHE